MAEKGEYAGDDVVHEVTVKLDKVSERGSPAAWTGLSPPGQVRT